MTGLSGAGKSTLAYALEKVLLERGHACYVLDGDNVRHGLNRDLGFSLEDRSENIRRVSEVARMMNEAGLIVITSLISPYRDDRERARQVIGEELFREIYIGTSLEVCEQRDTKGLYKRARSGELPCFTGISDPYQEPENPALQLDTAELMIDECLEKLIALIGPETGSGHEFTRINTNKIRYF
jgi:adenylyl-sulfate kinase